MENQEDMLLDFVDRVRKCVESIRRMGNHDPLDVDGEYRMMVHRHIDHATLGAAWIMLDASHDGTHHYRIWVMERCDIEPRLVMEWKLPVNQSAVIDGLMGTPRPRFDRVVLDRGRIMVRDRLLLRQHGGSLSDVSQWLSLDRKLPTEADAARYEQVRGRPKTRREEVEETRKDAFKKAMATEMQLMVWNHHRDSVAQLPAKVTNSAVDLTELDAAWVLLEQTRIIDRFPHSPIWRVGVFRYSVHRMRWQQPVIQLFSRDFKIQRLSMAPLSTWAIRGDIDHLYVGHESVGFRDSVFGWMRFDKEDKLVDRQFWPPQGRYYSLSPSVKH